uniref:Lon proteolytic domain-containing protein n=1 Tax=Meloidogyne hapla TaxID=6305 RepID=A0A1I8BEK6_MELHA
MKLYIVLSSIFYAIIWNLMALPFILFCCKRMTKRIIKIKQSNEQGKDEESLEENSDNCKETQSFHSSSESIRDSVYRTADDSIRSIYKSDCAKSDETEAKETAVGHFPILGYTSDGKGSQDWAVTTAHDFKVKILTGVQGENSEQLKQCAEIVRIFITSHLVELGLQHIDFKNKKKYYNTHIYPSSTDKSGYSAGPAIAISVISALKGKGALNELSPRRDCDPNKEWECADGLCIPISSLCDGKEDCVLDVEERAFALGMLLHRPSDELYCPTGKYLND